MFKQIIEIDYDVMDKFIVQSLKETLETLSSDYTKVMESGKGHVFSTDGTEDAKQLKKTVKALVRVLNWYSPLDSQLEVKDYV